MIKSIKYGDTLGGSTFVEASSKAGSISVSSPRISVGSSGEATKSGSNNLVCIWSFIVTLLDDDSGWSNVEIDKSSSLSDRQLLLFSRPSVSFLSIHIKYRELYGSYVKSRASASLFPSFFLLKSLSRR